MSITYIFCTILFGCLGYKIKIFDFGYSFRLFLTFPSQASNLQSPTVFLFMVIEVKMKSLLLAKGVCSGERDVVLHVPYLEMSDRDQMSSTFTEFHAGFEVVSSSIRHGGFC